jgi:hypothetical protein
VRPRVGFKAWILTLSIMLASTAKSFTYCNM